MVGENIETFSCNYLVYYYYLIIGVAIIYTPNNYTTTGGGGTAFVGRILISSALFFWSIFVSVEKKVSIFVFEGKWQHIYQQQRHAWSWKKCSQRKEVCSMKRLGANPSNVFPFACAVLKFSTEETLSSFFW